MTEMVDLLRQGREDDLWRMCCGFVDLNLNQFMAIQRRLLLEQIKLLNGSALGAKIMGGARPQSVEEFLKKVPLTTYSDYCPELLERREDVPPEPPILWQHSSGRTGEHGYKWVPLTARFCNRLAKVLLGVAILSASRGRAFNWIKERPKMFCAVAPRPHTTGTLVHILNREFPVHCMPPLEKAETMGFEDRVRAGFREALSKGLDGFCGPSVALKAIGEDFSRSASAVDILTLLSDPKALWRLSRGMIKSKLARRSLLPRDLWELKGIQSAGIDSSVLGGRIKQLWGRYPLNAYICTEGAVIATQTWGYRGMTFVPNLNFLEFIPEKEFEKSYADAAYKPGTVLLDGVRSGESYEVAITNFHGGALIRYRMGDIVKITAGRDEQSGINLPQMIFERRAGDLIDLGPIRLTETTIWQAIENSGIPYVDWAACKGAGEKPVLSLYLELKDGYTAPETTIGASIYEEIKKLDQRVNGDLMYSTLEGMLGRPPLEVFSVRPGTFAKYAAQRRAENGDMAHLKPLHMNPREQALAILRTGVKARVEEVARLPQAARPALFLIDSTTIPLEAGASYSGPVQRCDSYTRIVGTVFTDRSCNLSIEQTQDGVNWDYVSTYPVSPGIGVAFDAPVAAPLCRMKIENGPVAQMVLRAYMRGITK